MCSPRGSHDHPRTTEGLPREWLGLAVLALPAILVALDMSVLYLALPHLATGLGAGDVQQLWITDVYGFVLAAAALVVRLGA